MTPAPGHPPLRKLAPKRTKRPEQASTISSISFLKGYDSNGASVLAEISLHSDLNPSKPKPSVVGHWSKAEITATRIIWSDGRSDPAKITVSKDMSKLTMEQDGETYTATLRSNGNEMEWSGGDVWTREKSEEAKGDKFEEAKEDPVEEKQGGPAGNKKRSTKEEESTRVVTYR